ncbi:peptide chain release factor N(5)-glutamine methyltransferase [bacterium]|nr:peptide chain release factor N(5)-glutamine methyltransferase [bacterium]
MLRLCQAHLEEHGVPGARRSAELILCAVLGLDRLGLYLNHERPLTEDELERCRELLRRRAAHEPLQYITGRTAFRHLDLATGPGALVPRPETELLVDLVLEELKAKAGESVASPTLLPRVLDLGCGTGAVGLALAVEHPAARYVLSDLSAEALAWAVRNAQALPAGAGAVSFCRADLLSAFAARPIFDIIVSNPPYVSPAEMLSLPDEVRLYEPQLALDGGGADGTSVIERLTAQAVDCLRPGGLLAIETGESQHASLERIFAARSAKLNAPEFHRDLSGRERFVTARRLND